MKSKILAIIGGFVFTVITTGCTDLSETVYSDVMSVITITLRQMLYEQLFAPLNMLIGLFNQIFLLTN